MNKREEREYLKVPEVAAMLQVNKSTVYRWIQDGELGAIRLGPQNLRIRRDELERFLEERETS